MALSTDPLFDFYKRARNRLRRYTPESILNHAIGALYQVETGGVEVLRYYQPWNILLVIKWTLQEADPLSHRRDIATLNDLHAVLKILHDMGGNVRMPDEYEHASLFMRRLAFQQFALQKNPSADALVRQDILFSSLPAAHFFTENFRRITGFRPVDFVDLAFALLTLVLNSPTRQVVRQSMFANIAASFPAGTLDKFLRHLSKPVTELHTWLSTDEFKKMPVADQMILPSPLIEAPMIDIGSGSYRIIFPTLLMRSLESAVYRTLRNPNPAEFGSRFGPVFQNYVERVLDDAGVEFLNEDELHEQLPGEGKCVDFLVTEEHCNVLLDAKGVEMSALGRVSQRADLVLRTIKESAVKAIHQGMATAKRIRDLRGPATLPRKREMFLFAVTFDDLFLGSSADFGTIFGAHLLPKLERDFGTPLPLPLENVFFVTIYELEQLLEIVREQQATFTDILHRVQAQDADRISQRFTFQQHLDSFTTQERRLPMLKAGLNDLCHRCIVRLPETGGEKPAEE
jgi:hypothetical protein